MSAQLDESQVYDIGSGVPEPLTMPAKRSRGTSNGNVSGSAEDRRRRKAWLLETYRADVDVFVVEISAGPAHGLLVNPEPLPPAVLYLPVPHGDGELACRCYRCGTLLVFCTLTVDRIIPGARGGTYRRTNIRPACGGCNIETGNQLRAEIQREKKRKDYDRARKRRW